MPLVPQPFWRVRQITEMPDRYRFLDRFTDEQLATMPESLHATLVRIEEGFKKSWVESELRRIEMYKNLPRLSIVNQLQSPNRTDIFLKIPKPADSSRS
uniref:Uncharacterized protein n=1 Tax=Oryza meridionalis TaxID=40149 RepID=A0A0E0CS59_9ORYZ